MTLIVSPKADWLKQLGKAKEWETFEREYRGFVLEDPESYLRKPAAAATEAVPPPFPTEVPPDTDVVTH